MIKKIICRQIVGLLLLVNPVLFISADDQNPETEATVATEAAAKEHKKMSLVTAVPDLVVIDAYPDGDAWSRNTMTGNWGGKRQELADNGIFINMDVTQVVQGSTGGLGGATRTPVPQTCG